jgi:hypothetical protein
MEQIFGGTGFRMYIPEELFTEIIYPEADRQWVVYGNPPSPKSRAIGGRDRNGRDLGLHYAVRDVDGDRLVAFTCFQCHASVVAGKLVAGLGNAHVDQYAQVQNLGTVMDAVYMSQALVDAFFNLNDKKKEHLRQFVLYAETVLTPALDRAKARGDDFGPYPVWQLMARMIDPKTKGFDLHPAGASAPDLEKRTALVKSTRARISRSTSRSRTPATT